MDGVLISYAQNHEDVVLFRALGHLQDGFYVDVGAGHPVRESVTKVFYDRGWRGINVEPHSVLFQELERERPRDINLNAGVADRCDQLTYYESLAYPGASTFAKEIASTLPFEKPEIRARRLQVLTLASICEEYVDREITFLKVDAEGFEEKVIASADWRRWRPRVLVIEAVRPHSTIPAHEAWENVLLENGYLLTLFDGVNRFYVREEDSSLLPRLSVPANALDCFVPYRVHMLETGYRELELYARRLEEGLENWRSARRMGDEEVVSLLQNLSQDREAESRLRPQVERLEQERARLETSLAQLREERNHLEEKTKELECAVGRLLPRIGVIVVHHRGIEVLERCLRSVLGTADVNVKVVVVANGCTEPLPPLVTSHSRINVVQLTAPVSFARANNVGVEHLLAESSDDPEYLLFLNNDTVVEPDALGILASYLRNDPRCGIVGPRLMIQGSWNYLNSLGLNLTIVGEAWDEGIGRRVEQHGRPEIPVEVLAVTGSALMIRTNVFRQIGGWTELYNYYYEDIDLCLKARQRNWTVMLHPDAVVHHEISATAGRASDFKRDLMWRNRFLIMAVHWPLGLLLRILPRLVLQEIGVYVRRRMNGSHADARLQARSWRGALRRLPVALALRGYKGHRGGEWVGFLRPRGSTPVIRLPRTETEKTVVTTASGAEESEAT